MFTTDLRAGRSQISRISIALAGGQRDGTHDFYTPSLSADGSVAAFSSSATNLAPGAAPGARVFLARIPTSPARLLIGSGAGAGPRVRVPTPFEPGDFLRDFSAYDPRFSGGVTVAFGDVDGDGAADIVTGAGAGGGPHVRVFSAARHAAESMAVGQVPNELAGFYAYDPYFQGGVSVAVADVTGDGIGDIITGAGPGGGPHVRVFQVHTSWATGTAQITEYASFFAYQPGFSGGVRVAAGDLDGDGVSELLTAAGPGGGPHVEAFTLVGGTPVPVLSFFAYGGAFSGGVFVAAGDVDGDGRDEIVTGADAGGGPHVRVFAAGAGFSSLHERYSFFAYDPGFTGGVRVAAGDVDGDGRAELMTAPGPRGDGLVRVLKAVGAMDLMQFSAYSVSSTTGGFVAAPH